MSLKGDAHKFLLTGTYFGLWQRDEGWRVPESYRERLSFVASGRGLEG